MPAGLTAAPREEMARDPPGTLDRPRMNRARHGAMQRHAAPGTPEENLGSDPIFGQAGATSDLQGVRAAPQVFCGLFLAGGDVIMASYSVATVRRGLRTRKGQPGALSTLGEICKAGAQSKEVQSSKVASSALADLNAVVGTANGSLAVVKAKELELLTALRALQKDAKAVGRALSTYEAAVLDFSDGDPAAAAGAGVKTGPRAPSSDLARPVDVRARPSTNPMEAVLAWPAAPGATSYAVQLNFAPESPTPSWNDGGSATGRRRVLKGPAPGAQMLARVASIAADGRRSEWSDPVLVTVR
jgi:hypothetical protein